MKQSTFSLSGTALAGLATLLLLLTLSQIQCDRHGPLQSSGAFDFPTHLTPDMPTDVNIALKKDLESQSRFDSVQRLFDLVAWQAFVALNWPSDDKGNPRPKISDAGMPVWAHYKESFEVYKEDGSAPSPWGAPRDLDAQIPGVAGLIADAIQKNKRILYRNNKHQELANKADESNQAFSGGLWDKNGNLVMYEVLMNKTEFDYVVTNKLYNINGQVDFSNKKETVSFTPGNFDTKTTGAMEIKISWRVMDPDNDIIARYLTIDGYVPDPKQPGVTIDDKCVVSFPDNPSYIPVKLGMVGMHIAIKTVSSPQWIWATFEQVDNISADLLATGKTMSGKTVSLVPSFFDPNCIDCLPNTCPPVRNGKRSSQLIRMIPIPGDKRALNAQAARVLADHHSVLQYYELIDTQWPTDPSAKPTPPGQGLASVTNKAGGHVTPTFLTNMTMETYFQVGVQPAGKQEESVGKPPKPDLTPIWATESCTGCHYSAPIATAYFSENDSTAYGPPQSADFSWLLKTQARYNKK